MALSSAHTYDKDVDVAKLLQLNKRQVTQSINQSINQFNNNLAAREPESK